MPSSQGVADWLQAKMPSLFAPMPGKATVTPCRAPLPLADSEAVDLDREVARLVAAGVIVDDEQLANEAA